MGTFAKHSLTYWQSHHPQCDKCTTSDKSIFILLLEVSLPLGRRGSVRQRKFCAFYRTVCDKDGPSTLLLKEACHRAEFTVSKIGDLCDLLSPSLGFMSVKLMYECDRRERCRVAHEC
jgi:hypothetical protein